MGNNDSLLNTIATTIDIENNTFPNQNPNQEQINKKITNMIDKEFNKMTLLEATNETE